MIKSEGIIGKTEENIVHMYNRHKIVIEKGDGVYLYDVEGKKYLDFCAGIGIYALGYNNKYFNDKLKEQVDTLLHTSNLFYNVPLADAVENLAHATHMDKVFFTNSGAEAVEGALKMARRYAYNKHGYDKTQIIAMKNSFHGRTFGALSVTGTEAYRKPFGPLIGDVVFAEFNNIESVKKLINNNTCAIIMETLQGEGGIVPCTKEFITEIRKICSENDIAMICDEVQCGMGRTGKMFYYENYNVLPDIVVCAKAIGGGVPVGAFGAVEQFAEALVPGDHGTTYGGNPFAVNAVNTVFELFKKENILDNVNNTAPYLEKELDKLVEKYDSITARRGTGLMQGLVFNDKVKNSDIVAEALKEGLITAAAHGNVIRLLPPLIIEKIHVDEMISILESVLKAV